MVDPHLLEYAEYDIEIVNWIDGSKRSNINKMILRPIEAGNIIEFSKGKEIQFTITSQTLGNINPLAETKQGFLRRKKEDMLLEIQLNYDSSGQHQYSDILLNIEDKYIQKIIQHIQTIKNLENNNYWSNYNQLPFFLEGESMVWHNLQTEGLINKRAKWLEAITNYRILQYSFMKHAANYITYGALEDVIVMNQKRISQSNAYGSYARSKYHVSGIGTTRSSGTTVGDVVFIAQGRPIVTFTQIQDPSGLVKLVKSIMK